MQPIADALARCHVLVVEDDTVIQQLLIGSFLEELHIKDVTYALDGVDGLAQARRRRPDLVVLDIEMPRMNGLEMLRHLRADQQLRDIPVIVQTGHDSAEQREQMFLAGATDYVLKPLHGQEFKGRIRVHLENLLHLRNLADDLARIAHELEDAAQLQRALLPSPASLAAIARKYGLGIDPLFRPSSQLGGDFWGLIPVDERALAIYSCDFAGHGVSAAMNTFQLHVLLNGMPPPLREDPAAFVGELNHALHGSLRQRQYATFFLGIIDLEHGLIRYCANACPDPLLRSADQVVRLDGSGMPLGALPRIVCENRTIAFPPGAALFLYSDALSEPLDIEGRVVPGMEQACLERIAALRPFRPGLVADAVDSCWPASRALADDLTAIWIERMP